MKILFCTPTFQTDTHGPARFAKHVFRINDLYPEHQVMILTEDPPKKADPRIQPITLSCPRPFHAFIHFFRMHAYHIEAKKLRKVFPFDIIVYNHAWDGYLSAWTWKDKVKVAGMLNDDENLRMNWRLLTRIPVRKWIIRRLSKAFEKRFARLAWKTITDSKYLANRVQDEYQIKSESLEVLYQGVDVEAFPFIVDRPLSLSRRIRVLFVKSDFRRGGLLVLLEALHLLRDFTFELLIVGSTVQQIETLIDLTKYQTGLQISIKGPLPSKQVQQLMVSADILCIPSLREALGVANIEGLASGIPVVSSRVGGIPEVLGNGAFGWLAAPGDAQDLASCISQCLTQSEDRHTRRLAGRLFVVEKFRHSTMLTKYLNILASPPIN